MGMAGYTRQEIDEARRMAGKVGRGPRVFVGVGISPLGGGSMSIPTRTLSHRHSQAPGGFPSLPLYISERNYLLDELGDPNAPVGSRLWCLYMANEMRRDLYENTQSEQRLYYLVENFKKHTSWAVLGFESWEDFCFKKLHAQRKG